MGYDIDIWHHTITDGMRLCRVGGSRKLTPLLYLGLLYTKAECQEAGSVGP